MHAELRDVVAKKNFSRNPSMLTSPAFCLKNRGQSGSLTWRGESLAYAMSIHCGSATKSAFSGAFAAEMLIEDVSNGYRYGNRGRGEWEQTRSCVFRSLFFASFFRKFQDLFPVDAGRTHPVYDENEQR